VGEAAGAGVPQDASVSPYRTEPGSSGRGALAKPHQPQHPPTRRARLRTISELQRPKARPRLPPRPQAGQ